MVDDGKSSWNVSFFLALPPAMLFRHSYFGISFILLVTLLDTLIDYQRAGFCGISGMLP